MKFVSSLIAIVLFSNMSHARGLQQFLGAYSVNQEECELAPGKRAYISYSKQTSNPKDIEINVYGEEAVGFLLEEGFRRVTLKEGHYSGYDVVGTIDGNILTQKTIMYPLVGEAYLSETYILTNHGDKVTLALDEGAGYQITCEFIRK